MTVKNTSDVAVTIGSAVVKEITPIYQGLIKYNKDMEAWCIDDLGTVIEPLFKECLDKVHDNSTSIATPKSLERVSNNLVAGALVDNAHEIIGLQRELNIRRRTKSDYFFEAISYYSMESSHQSDVLNTLKGKLG